MLEGEQGGREFVLLAGDLVVIACKLRFHLGHVGLALLPYFGHHLSLTQGELALLAFLFGHLHRTLIVEHVAIGLEDLQGKFILLGTQLAASHQQAGLGCTKLVDTLEAIEDGKCSLYRIAIIKGTHVGIGIRLGVDGTSEVILCTDTAIDRRQEGTDGPGAFGTSRVLRQLADADVVIVFHRIAHAVVSRQCHLLGSDAARCQQQCEGDECSVHILQSFGFSVAKVH